MQALRRQKLRLRQLSQCVDLIQSVTVEIRYGSLPVLDIVRRLAENEAFQSLDFLHFVAGDAASDFSAAWQNAITGSDKLALKPEEKAVLIRFGKSLGTTDADTQLLLCERFHAQLGAMRERAEARQAESTRTLFVAVAAASLFVLALML